MKVKKRDGRLEDVSFDKVLRRIQFLSGDLQTIDPTKIAQKVCSRIYDGVPTSELDELAARLCVSKCTDNPEFGALGLRIIISNNQKNTPDTFSECMSILAEANVLHPDVARFVRDNKEALDNAIVHKRDYNFTYFSYKTQERSYLIKVNKQTMERIQYMFMRVSCGLHYPNTEEVIRSYNLMSQQFFTHASPTLFNSGTISPQLLSCFLTAPDDSIVGMYDWIKNLALISKRAGGIGGSVTSIRSEGAYIRGTNGISRGIKPMLKVVNETLKHVNQGGRRPGSAAIYLEPHHPDIMHFLELRLNHGNEDDRCRDLFLAVWASDLFMERVQKNERWTFMDPDECPGLDTCYGDKYRELYERYEAEGKGRKTVMAQDVWKAITRSQIETGVPYVLFKDACNEKSNQKNLGTIRGSNLCVSPNTKILTETGYQVIKDLEDQYVNVWNGEEFSEALVRKTGENQPMLKMTFSNGAELECTEYHKFYISPSYSSKKPKTVEARDLKPGDKLWKCDFPVITKGVEMKYPYTHGFFCAEGTYYNAGWREQKCSYKSVSGTAFCKRHQDYSQKDTSPTEKCQATSGQKMPRITLYGDKKELVNYLETRRVDSEDSNGRINCFPHLDLQQKFFVPLNGSLATKLRWLEGYCDGDGTVAKNGTNESLQISSIDKDFLLQVRLLCQTLGIDPKVTKNKSGGLRELPDGNGRSKEYICKSLYRLLITSCDLYKLSQIGFSPKRLRFTVREPQRDARQFVKVSKIEKSENSDTYCFGEPKKHAGIFNGVYTSQCAEILEYHDATEYACCCLASVCLPKFVDEKTGEYDFKMLEEVTAQCVRNLNEVIDRNMYPVEETKVSNMRHRPLGIGVQGLADTFFKMRIPFERDGKASPEALKLNREIFETMYYSAMRTSLEEAKKHGAYSTFKGSPLSEGKFQFDLWGVKPSDRYDWETLRAEVMEHGVRNSLLIACMPTASTAQIMGNTECFEPMTSNMYVRRTLSGDFVIANEYLIKDLQEMGLWSTEMKDQIVGHDGSIQYIDGIPKEMKDLYKTAWELKQKTLMDLSIGRAPFICQTQSLNLFFEEPTTKTLTQALFYAWKNGLKTGCYYIRSRPKAQAQQFTVDPELAQRIRERVEEHERSQANKKGEERTKDGMRIVCTDDICMSCSG